MPDPRQPQRPLGQRLLVRFEQVRAALQVATRRICRQPAATGLTAAAIGAALVLPAALLLFGRYGLDLDQRLDSAREISAYLRPGVSEASALQLTRLIGHRPDVAGSRYVSPEQGLVEFRRWSGLGPAVDALGHNPLPGVIVVLPRSSATDVASVDRLLADLQQLAPISEAHANSTWIHRYASLGVMVRRLAVLLALLLSASALLTIGNTIRLQVDAARPELEILELVGADASFIRRPFVFAGIGYGLLGGGIALLLLSGVVLALRSPVADLAAAYGSAVHLPLPSGALAGGLLLAAAVLGGLAGGFATTAQLRKLHLSRSADL